MTNRSALFVVPFLFAVTARAEVQLPVMGGTFRPLKPVSAKLVPIVGRIGGCSGAIVSPPGSPLTAVAFAAHCGNGSEFRSGSEVIGGFKCFNNREFQNCAGIPGSAGCDQGICFSAEKRQGTAAGCIASQEKFPVKLGDTLLSVGYGNPVFGQAPVETPNIGKMEVKRIQVNGAIVAGGEAYVTPGDSGGPVFPRGELGEFPPIVGFNSKWVGSSDGNHDSAFAPAGTKQSFDFYGRALAKAREVFANELQGKEPLVCGVNFDPSSKKKPPTDDGDSDSSRKDLADIEIRSGDQVITMKPRPGASFSISFDENGKMLVEETGKRIGRAEPRGQGKSGYASMPGGRSH